MPRLLDSLLDELKNFWKTPHAPHSKRAFRCDCGRSVFFRNSHCLGCDSPLGYEPILGEMLTLKSGDTPGTWRSANDREGAGNYRRCSNFDSPAGCNWLVQADDTFDYCIACRLNRTVADLDDADNQRYWRSIEAAKRRLISQLLALELPVECKTENPAQGLAFDLLRSPADGPLVLTGHDNGLITLNIEEADDVKREEIRVALHEPYRTLLGHFRHEIGHYYWDRLIRDGEWLEAFRSLFGDERADYSEAIENNYENGPSADWADRHISAYASSHPWEDWAESWAHYLHIVDSLDTAIAHGLEAEDLEMEIEPFTRDDLFDPDDAGGDRFLFFLNAWVEMITVLNEMARSLGQRDFYPFVMPRVVVRKLHFVHLVVNGTRTGT